MCAAGFLPICASCGSASFPSSSSHGALSAFQLSLFLSACPANSPAMFQLSMSFPSFPGFCHRSFPPLRHAEVAALHAKQMMETHVHVFACYGCARRVQLRREARNENESHEKPSNTKTQPRAPPFATCDDEDIGGMRMILCERWKNGLRRRSRRRDASSTRNGIME